MTRILAVFLLAGVFLCPVFTGEAAADDKPTLSDFESDLAELAEEWLEIEGQLDDEDMSPAQIIALHSQLQSLLARIQAKVGELTDSSLSSEGEGLQLWSEAMAFWRMVSEAAEAIAAKLPQAMAEELERQRGLPHHNPGAV